MNIELQIVRWYRQQKSDGIDTQQIVRWYRHTTNSQMV